MHQHHSLSIPLGPVLLQGDLALPEGAAGLVLFVQGSDRHSPRNVALAKRLQRSQWATLLVDLLTEEEDRGFGSFFDIELLTRRLLGVTRWTRQHLLTAGLPIGYLGVGAGTASALCAAAELGSEVRAVVCRNGRPDLATEALGKVVSPTLLIAGDQDPWVLALQWQAYYALRTVKRLEVVQGATPLFAEPRSLEQVGDLAAEWFALHLARPAELQGAAMARQTSEEKPREVWLD